jgi:hypothetical protein
MFVFDRSAFAVVLPLALLLAVVLWSNRGTPQPGPRHEPQAVAVNLPAR